MEKKIEVWVGTARATFETWLARGDAVGVFTDQDLSSATAGQHVFIPLKPEEMKDENIGKMSAPDGDYGPGWRYILTSIEKTLDAFEFKVSVWDGKRD